MLPAAGALLPIHVLLIIGDVRERRLPTYISPSLILGKYSAIWICLIATCT